MEQTDFYRVSPGKGAAFILISLFTYVYLSFKCN